MTTPNENEKPSLEERVQQFNSLRLPGQPMGMHMGTSYLVNDLWRALKEANDRAERLLDSEADKIMAMTAQQVSALIAATGHHPDDAAKLVKQAAEIATLRHDLRTALAALPADREPVAWLVVIDHQQHQYVTDDPNDAQMLDDLTNENAVVHPLYAAPSPSDRTQEGKL